MRMEIELLFYLYLASFNEKLEWFINIYKLNIDDIFVFVWFISQKISSLNLLTSYKHDKNQD